MEFWTDQKGRHRWRIGMAEEKEGNHHTSVLERKGGMGNGSLCTGNVVGKIFKRRFGQLSSVFVEMR